MSRAADLHPDDRAARLHLRDQLAQARRDRGLSQRDLAAHLGIGQGAIGDTETSRTANMVAANAQHRARVLAHRLTFHIDRLAVPADPAAATLHHLATNATTDTAEDEHHLAATTAHLYAIRRWTGMTGKDFARRIAADETAVNTFERHVRTPLLGTIQRYTRGLGGVLRFHLQPLD